MTEDAYQALNTILGIEKNQHRKSLEDVYDNALLFIFSILWEKPRTYVSVYDVYVVLTICSLIEEYEKEGNSID